MAFSKERRRNNYKRLKEAGFNIKLATKLKDMADWKIDYIIRQKIITDDLMGGHIEAISGVGGFKNGTIEYSNGEEE